MDLWQNSILPVYHIRDSVVIIHTWNDFRWQVFVYVEIDIKIGIPHQKDFNLPKYFGYKSVNIV